MPSWLRYLLAFIVACHGLVYVILPFVDDAWREWTGRSQLVPGIAGDRLKHIVRVSHVAAGVTTMACGVAIALAGVAPSLWWPLAVTGSILGLVAFALFWDGQGRRLMESGLIGAVLSVVLLIMGLAFPDLFA